MNAPMQKAQPRPNGTAAAVVAQQLAGKPAPTRSEATKIEQSRAVAEVQAMVVTAQARPRDVTGAMGSMRESCAMMQLAERAFFKFPRGGQTVSGPSIHLAVELARCWGNINYGIRELSRSDTVGESEMQAFAWDIQTNTRADTTFIVPHRRDKKGGAEWLSDMRDIYENNANNGARRLREMIFRVLPPWYIEQAKELCHGTLQRGVGDEPLAVRIAKMVEAFAKLGISRERIEAKSGPLASLTAVDLANLQVSFQSLRRGEINADEEFPSVTAAALSASLSAADDQPAGPATPAGGEPAKEGAAPPADPAPAPPTPAPSPESSLQAAHKAGAETVYQRLQRMIDEAATPEALGKIWGDTAKDRDVLTDDEDEALGKRLRRRRQALTGGGPS